ncbi:hypothetical protein A3197_01045 [Candidatus Thiodiazotropha endoloripes]|nr:hypothetical protein A3197_01045 [Candidatus Thiodiazotropha endoloripes]
MRCDLLRGTDYDDGPLVTEKRYAAFALVITGNVGKSELQNMLMIIEPKLYRPTRSHKVAVQQTQIFFIRL